MKLNKLLLAGSAMALLAAGPSQASVIDNPHFKVLGLVVVWGADASGNAPIVSDFVIDSAVGAGDADLIAGDVHTVVTGTLNPTPDTLAGATPFDVTGEVSGAVFTDAGTLGVLDAADSFTAFEIDGATDIALTGAQYNSSFYVASNTAFALNAQASTVAANTVNFALTDVGYSLAMTQSGNDGLAFGGNAQLPHTGNTATSGVVATVNDLGDMSAATNVFTGNRRTAATAGSIAAQSVRFNAQYSLGGATGYDLSMGVGEIEANVTYTVFVP